MGELERLGAALAPSYVLEREIGHGALGTVYAARTARGETAAVKVLSADLVRLMRAPDQFIRSMQRAQQLKHDALVPILGAHLSADGDLYYGMGLAEGPTARERLEQDGMLSATEVASVGARICDALGATLTTGLVHGGIRPSSVHFTPDGVKLADLGVHAGLLAAGIKPEQLTEIVGVPQYLSPEQIAATQLDGRADIYSLGATLYELLTGKPPFGGRTTTSVMASVLADEPAVPGGEDASGPVVDAVLRAIEKVPADRWSSANAFARALQGSPSAQGSTPETKSGCMGVVVVGVGLAEVIRVVL